MTAPYVRCDEVEVEVAGAWQEATVVSVSPAPVNGADTCEYYDVVLALGDGTHVMRRVDDFGSSSSVIPLRLEFQQVVYEAAS